VFRLSAEALRAAGGQVRCGRCGEVFNALSRLAEDADGFTKGESPLFLETRAEEILESNPFDAEPPVQVDDLELAPGVEFAELQFIEPVDDELAAETSLEFTLPPGELDRIFIETRRSPLRELATDVQRGERSDRGEPGPPVPHPESVAARPEPPARKEAPTPAPTVVPATAAPQTAAPGPRPLTRVPGLEVSEEVRREVLSSLRIEAEREVDAKQDGARRRARFSFAAWLTAALVLAILLGWQFFRGNRDWVAAHVPLLGGGSAANPAAYQLRQWGITGDPGAKGTLRVRASIMNTAAQLQPYPLLRVTLVNRFGTHVAAREFEPAEYLGHGIARMLAPGERIEATLDILDPGKDAEGFEIDVCLRNAEQRIVCAGDAATQVK